jgi:hypothetical protein
MKLKSFSILGSAVDLLLTIYKYHHISDAPINSPVLIIVTYSLDDNSCIEAIFRHGYTMYMGGLSASADLLCLLNSFHGDE